MTRVISSEKGGIGTIVATDVDSAIVSAVKLLKEEGLEIASRAGPTLEYPTPVVTIYKNPSRKVSFMEARDANPFFHLFESLWMLGGGDDLPSLLIFNSKFGQFSDDGKTIRGSAYGRRWRTWFGHDQLTDAVQKLKNTPGDRRVVLQMWDAFSDPVVQSKDVPCNTVCYFRCRDGKTLDLTVSNRSNDAIYGALGSNVVHFSLLLEYVASSAGLEVGTYYQFSNSYHGYVENPIFAKLLSGSTAPATYEKMGVQAFPLNSEDGAINEDIMLLMKFVREVAESPDKNYITLMTSLNERVWNTEFFRKVVGPMMIAYFSWKTSGGIKWAQKNFNMTIDWHNASMRWLERRMKNG